MAADDLYAAATALVSDKSIGSAVGDVRRWRLLREADARLRARLSSAQPSEKARSSGLTDPTLHRVRRAASPSSRLQGRPLLDTLGFEGDSTDAIAYG